MSTTNERNPEGAQRRKSYGTNDRSHRAAVRQLLKDGLWHTLNELQAVGGTRFGARIHELRHRENLVIEVRCLDKGLFGYRLVGERAPVVARPKSWKQRAEAAEARVAQLERRLNEHSDQAEFALAIPPGLPPERGP